MLDRARLFRELKDANSGEDFFHLSDGEAVRVDVCAVSTLKSRKHAWKVAGAAWSHKLLSKSVMLGNGGSTLNDFDTLAGEFLCTFAFRIASQRSHGVRGGRAIRGWLQEGFDDGEALGTRGTDNEDKFARGHGSEW